MTNLTPQQHHHAMLSAIKAAWVERRDALGLKGKKADNECLAFVIGARAGMVLASNPVWPPAEGTRTPLDGVIFVVSVRGQVGFMAWEG